MISAYRKPTATGTRRNPITITARRTAAFRPGFDRTGGFYGRYSYGARGGELKFHDVDADDAGISAAGTLLNTGSINLIPQGITEKTRVGRKCVVRSIDWKYNISKGIVPGSASSPGETVRVILYKDKQCNGATATVLGILETDNYQSFRNLANSGRFVILMDRVHDINVLAAAGDGAVNDESGLTRHYKFHKACAVPLEFDAAAGAITEIRSNNFGVLLLSKTGALTSFDSKLRLRFSDN